MTNAQVYQGFLDDTKVEERCFMWYPPGTGVNTTTSCILRDILTKIRKVIATGLYCHDTTDYMHHTSIHFQCSVFD